MTRSRFAFIQDKDNLLLIVRAIGETSGDVVADNIINAYRSVEAPWTVFAVPTHRPEDDLSLVVCAPCSRSSA